MRRTSTACPGSNLSKPLTALTQWQACLAESSVHTQWTESWLVRAAEGGRVITNFTGLFIDVHSDTPAFPHVVHSVFHRAVLTQQQ